MSTNSSTGVVRRPIVCLVDHLHRDLGVAEDATAGRFTHAGVTLDLGLRPDWRTGGLAHDEEWRIEWVKLYEGLDLGHAYQRTGDPRFLRTWESLVEGYCDQIPVGAEASDISARRMLNWLYAWHRFAAAPAHAGLDDALAGRTRDRLLADAEHLRAHLTPERNHRTLELYTLLLVGLALDPDRSRAGDALRLLAENAATDIWDDGVHRECSTDYHHIVLRSFVGAIANARHVGLAVPAALQDRVKRACDFALHVQRPDGITPALSDGDPGDYRMLLDHAGALLDRPDLTWAASGGTRGAPPPERSVTFPVGGYCIQRSGWGTGVRPYAAENYCVFDCGPVGDGGHGHYDQLSVEIAGGGRPLLVDPGRFTYAGDDGGWRRAFKGTAAHNTVCVDGLDQTPFRPGKPNGPTATARLVARRWGPGLDVVMAEVRSPNYEAVHTRLLAFVDGAYWVVHDRLRGERPHRYEARWHLTAEAWDNITLTTDDEQTAVRAPGLALAVPRWCGRVSLEAGWVSPAYGVKEPAPVVVVTVDGRADADVVTVVLPASAPLSVSAHCDAHGANVDVTTTAHADRTWWRAGRELDAGWWRWGS